MKHHHLKKDFISIPFRHDAFTRFLNFSGSATAASNAARPSFYVRLGENFFIRIHPHYRRRI